MKIGVLFGGRSYEHDISIITAVQAVSVLRGVADVIPIYARDGEFFYVKKGMDVASFASHKSKLKEATLGKNKGKGGVRVGRKFLSLDCMLMCCHGGEGENGCFSALMEINDIPYTCSGVLSSALTMDKRASKVTCELFGFCVPRAVWGKRGEDLPKMAKSLHFPLIVKPARLGSSIGIEVAHDEIELIHALAIAFSFDRDVIVEEVVEDAVELNCAAMKEGETILLGEVENPRSWHEFLTFEDKYQGGKQKSGQNSLIRGELAERVKAETKKVYRSFELFGIVRVDYLYSPKTNTLYLNEINSQPGSLACYLFEEAGVDYCDLLMRSIHEGIKRFEKKDIISFNSGVLDNLSALGRK